MLQSRIIRRKMFGDKQWIRYMDEQWGLDVLGQQIEEKARYGSLDPYYFWKESLMDCESETLKVLTKTKCGALMES